MDITKTLLTAMILGTAIPTVGASDAWREIPYRTIHDAYASVPHVEGKYIRMRKQFTVPGEFRIQDLRVIVASAAGDIEVGIGEDGTHDFPMSQALYDENPPVRTNAPPGRLGSAATFSIEAEPMRRFSYSVVREMADEYAAAVRGQGLLARIAFPRARGLAVEFDGPGGRAEVGGEVFDADDEHSLTIPFRRAWDRSPPEIVFSRVPSRVTLALR